MIKNPLTGVNVSPTGARLRAAARSGLEVAGVAAAGPFLQGRMGGAVLDIVDSVPEFIRAAGFPLPLAVPNSKWQKGRFTIRPANYPAAGRTQTDLTPGNVQDQRLQQLYGGTASKPALIMNIHRARLVVSSLDGWTAQQVHDFQANAYLYASIGGNIRQIPLGDAVVNRFSAATVAGGVDATPDTVGAPNRGIPGFALSDWAEFDTLSVDFQADIFELRVQTAAGAAVAIAADTPIELQVQGTVVPQGAMDGETTSCGIAMATGPVEHSATVEVFRRLYPISRGW